MSMTRIWERKAGVIEYFPSTASLMAVFLQLLYAKIVGYIRLNVRKVMEKKRRLIDSRRPRLAVLEPTK